MRKHSTGNAKTIDSLRKTKELAHNIEQALKQENLDEFGKLIEEAGKTQKSYHKSIYPKRVLDILSIASQNGAIGSKLAGVGGGGALYLFCKKEGKTKLISALKNQNVLIIPIEFSKKGLTVWKSGN